MKKENEENRNLPVSQTSKKKNKNLIGYPASPAGEDIYNNQKEEKDIDPENISKSKPVNKTNELDPNNEQDFMDDMVGNDLDVPGSELDDKMEAIGSEDEENNYYSLGGDDHNDLDESTGG